jgi:hypothetical protein
MNAPQQTQEAESVRSWHLMRQEELRIEVDKDVKITLKATPPSILLIYFICLFLLILIYWCPAVWCR